MVIVVLQTPLLDLYRALWKREAWQSLRWPLLVAVALLGYFGVTMLELYATVLLFGDGSNVLLALVGTAVFIGLLWVGQRLQSAQPWRSIPEHALRRR
jgi:hypothetical protein